MSGQKTGRIIAFSNLTSLCFRNGQEDTNLSTFSLRPFDIIVKK